MYKLSILEIILFLSLFLLEHAKPARQFPIPKMWFKHWCELMSFAIIWLSGLLAVWPYVSPIWQPLDDWPFWGQVITTYLTYSFVAYWYHRIRHNNRFLWRFVHYMHHAPAHMDTRVTFWRHPIEMIIDSLVILSIGKFLGVNAEIIFCVLIIESMLEIFHHSNIHTPKCLRWVGYFIQIPEQHLIHHQQGLHRWNYATVTLWDTLFGTVQVPDDWKGAVGLPEWNSTRKLLLFKY
ncbi:MAG: sterol desaturase family protein [Gammaproteobacteria bacterium]|nr:sterol desaturase family protein [Gammaproteobacteria bacterium]